MCASWQDEESPSSEDIQDIKKDILDFDWCSFKFYIDAPTNTLLVLQELFVHPDQQETLPLVDIELPHQVTWIVSHKNDMHGYNKK